MFYINKKLIKLYLDKKQQFIYTKSKSTTVTKDVFGKCFVVYNGKKWLKKNIDNSYYLNKSVGLFKKLNSKKTSVYRRKKNKKKQTKKA